MEHEELVRLLEALPGGEWHIESGRYPDARTVVAHTSRDKTVTIASDVAPEAAAFLVTAQELLPALIAEIAEERAYYARLAAENERLHKTAFDLSSQLLEKEQEIYELSEARPDCNPPPGSTLVAAPSLTLTAGHVSLASL